MTSFTEQELDDLMYSEEYAEYIMEHAQGDRIICNGHTLTAAMEDGYLWDDFLEYMEQKKNGAE